ncbi:MAG: hypothetical protein IJS08_12490 [Victivallales bacterium]|nr:hypothetical protein [Victivallales bacterium]
MKLRNGRFNQKKEFKLQTPQIQKALQQLSTSITYKGNPAHKKNPGDFGLTPPSGARLGKSLCDEVGIFTLREAQTLLREGMKLGLVSVQERNGFPQNIWMVLKREEEFYPLEAQLENAIQGQYHGYPLQQSDPFYDEVLRKWSCLYEQA